jgi:hypothetical protein
VLGVLALTLSCSGDGAVEPATQANGGPQQSAVAQQNEVALGTAGSGQGGEPSVDEGRLRIEDLLGDPLFQQLVVAIDQPSLSAPLLAAVEALASGHRGTALSLLEVARAEAEALAADPLSAEALLYWSAIVPFLEESNLIRRVGSAGDAETP